MGVGLLFLEYEIPAFEAENHMDAKEATDHDLAPLSPPRTLKSSPFPMTMRLRMMTTTSTTTMTRRLFLTVGTK